MKAEDLKYLEVKDWREEKLIMVEINGNVALAVKNTPKIYNTGNLFFKGRSVSIPLDESEEKQLNKVIKS